MKKQAKKTYDAANGTRDKWKESAADEIRILEEKILELELPENTVMKISNLIAEFKQELNTVIECATITPEMVFQTDDLFYDCLYEIWVGHQAAGESECEKMVEITSEQKRLVFIKAESLAEKIRVEEFINTITENPYQLKLIA